MTDWDARWMGLAAHIGSWSKDRKTRVGCVIIGDTRQILSTGYNGFPRGVDDDVDARHDPGERHGRREKLRWTEHAERNAIYDAALRGISLRGSVMYGSLYPCSDCARGIIQAGLAGLAVPEPDRDLVMWHAEFEVSKIMMQEAGVTVRFVPSPSHGEDPGH